MVIDKESLLNILEKRHAVRRFSSIPLDNDERERIYYLLKDLNEGKKVRMEAFVDEPDAFDCPSAKFMRFKNANNYIAFFVPKDSDEALVEAGEVGALVSLSLLLMGLGSCFVAGTFSRKKSHAQPKDGEKLPFVLAFGRGGGKPHNAKAFSKLSKDYENGPEWFKKGIESIALAPSSINRFPYVFSLENGEAVGVPYGDSLSLIDLGIAKFYFDLSAEGHVLTAKIEN